MKAFRFFSLFAGLVLGLFSASLLAQTPPEPTVRQIYETATGGDLPGAQRMIDQVIVAHPKSARAHYVKAELSARERDAATARTELETAERLAPGLPFARADAVSALRAQIDRLAAAPAGTPQPRATQPRTDTRRMGAPPQEGGSGGFPVGGILLIAIIGIAVFAMMRRRRAAAMRPPMAAGPAQQPWGYQGGATAPTVGRRGFDLDPPRRFEQDMGAGGGMGPMGPQPGSMGSSIMRGVGTGLAVGAGAIAAQEIGRRLFDHGRETQHDAMTGLGAAGAADSQIARDAGIGSFTGQSAAQDDLGGQDFGMDPGGWDDGGGGGGGDDWEN